MKALCSVIVLAGLARSAAADDAKPWATGVPESEQQVALSIYRAGNAEFEESRYAQALAKYREAVKHWDHPSIHFNMTVCLINLEQPLEAWEHLDKALAYGDKPLGHELYAEGITYKKLLAAQLANVEVTCEAEGAEVTLDGQKLLTCPGKAKRLVRPGTHQIVASKAGFQTETTSLVMIGGKEVTHAVKLSPLGGRTKLVRRWKARTPWLVVGAGAGAAALGGIALYLAKTEYDTYNELLETKCPSGCTDVPSDVNAHESKGRMWNITGVSLLALGSAGIVAGLVGVYLNQPRSVVEVNPTITPNTLGASARWTF